MDDRNLVRVGIVSSVNTTARKVRVYYPQLDKLVSDWISVLQQPLSVSTGTTNDHKHSVNITGWMPKVNDRVLVLYAQGFSSDGYVLGVIP